MFVWWSKEQAQKQGRIGKVEVVWRKVIKTWRKVANADEKEFNGVCHCMATLKSRGVKGGGECKLGIYSNSRQLLLRCQMNTLSDSGIIGCLVAESRQSPRTWPIKHHSVVFIKVSNASMNPLISMLSYVEIFSY